MRLVLATGEVQHVCAWCPARFATPHDLLLHMKCFGRNEYDHKRYWKYLCGVAEREKQQARKFKYRRW